VNYKNFKYLHIGCGNNILPKPFLNIDVRKKKNVFNLKAYPLKFKNDSFELVYASHILEHFKKNQILKVLKEWIRVLKPGGILRISVPSFENLTKIYNIDKNIDNISGPLMGGQSYKDNFHYEVFNKKKLINLLNEAGLEAVHPWDYRRTIHSKFWDFSQATTNEIPISLNLEGRKKILYSNYEYKFSEFKKILKSLKKNQLYKKKIKSIINSI
jgi:predicted SAM-dependent methyltransferase